MAATHKTLAAVLGVGGGEEIVDLTVVTHAQHVFASYYVDRGCGGSSSGPVYARPRRESLRKYVSVAGSG